MQFFFFFLENGHCNNGGTQITVLGDDKQTLKHEGNSLMIRGNIYTVYWHNTL